MTTGALRIPRSQESGSAPASGPATATTPAVRPRPALSRLPRYAAGKPPVVVDGLGSYKLSSNENPFGPVPAVKEVLAGWDAVHRYPETTSAELREVLGEFLGVPAEDIVTGAGSLGALNQLLGAFVGAGEDGTPDEVVHAWRSFEAYPISIGLSGGLGVPVPNRRDGSHDLEAMAAAVTARTKVVLLCTPNNPTGPSLTTAQVEEFLAAVPRDVVVVIDEAYQEFVRQPDAVDGEAEQPIDPREPRAAGLAQLEQDGARLALAHPDGVVAGPRVDVVLAIAAGDVVVAESHRNSLPERAPASVAERGGDLDVPRVRLRCDPASAGSGRAWRTSRCVFAGRAGAAAGSRDLLRRARNTRPRCAPRCRSARPGRARSAPRTAR